MVKIICEDISQVAELFELIHGTSTAATDPDNNNNNKNNNNKTLTCFVEFLVRFQGSFPVQSLLTHRTILQLLAYRWTLVQISDYQIREAAKKFFFFNSSAINFSQIFYFP